MTVPSVSRNRKPGVDPGYGLAGEQAGEPEGDTVPRALNVPVGWLPSAGCPIKPQARTAVAAVEAKSELRMEGLRLVCLKRAAAGLAMAGPTAASPTA